MANQDQGEGGVVKTALMFLAALAVAAVYYFLLDKIMMGPVQNLPFPYK